jgi:hypothetical protein
LKFGFNSFVLFAFYGSYSINASMISLF